MILFNNMIDSVIRNTPEYSFNRLVIEKEVLHHDILFVMKEQGFFNHLTFIGGTCLRMCYGSSRLSEDLDFNGGKKFDKDILSRFSTVVSAFIMDKYGLKVEVSEPMKEDGNVDTWKIKIITQPEKKHIPAQRINIDICAAESYEREAHTLKNYYAIPVPTQGIILYTESKKELFADKLLAFAMRKNRIKFRDVWDIIHINERIDNELLQKKLHERDIPTNLFLDNWKDRLKSLKMQEKDFFSEITRFIPEKELFLIGNKQEYFLWCSVFLSEQLGQFKLQ